METFRIERDNSEILKQLFYNLLNSDKSKDVTLVGNDNTVIEAHKFVLTGLSQVFESLLSSSSHPHPLIFLPHIPGPLLRDVINFMYTGQANVKQDNIQEFLDLCKTFKMEGVDNMTEHTQEKHLDGETQKNYRDIINNTDNSKLHTFAEQINHDTSEYNIKNENASIVEKFFEAEPCENVTQI